MNSFSEKLRTVALVAIVGWMAGAPTPARAADLNIADSPLFVATNVEPNLMFTLDDSGSMQWEFMPDGPDFRFNTYMFPMPTGIYGGENYANQIPNFEDDNIHNFFGRSAANNSVFYNPDITYQPWFRSDGSQMPDANPRSALYNPAIPGLGALDLTSRQTQFACWFSHPSSTVNAFGDPCNGNHSFWPITYFNYLGGPRNLRTSYLKIEISSDTPAGTIFTSPEGVTRTRDEEIQNFANWFQYHRSRVLTARGAIGQAFVEMPDQARVGFGAINKDGTTVDGVNNTRVVINGVRSFNITGRSGFYNNLYNHVLNRQGTPLRTAALAVGQYFERSDSQGPWSTSPGVNGGEDLACRQSFHILMSDGFWNGNNPGVGNVDGTSGPTITGPDIGQGPQSFTYNAVDPFSDDRSNTLADVGMHYWKRDLRPDITNRVSTTPEDPAFWQHLTSFGIALGLPDNASEDDVDSVDPDAAFAAIDTQSPIAWGDPANNNIAKVNDMLHFGLNGRGGFFTATRPDVFARELADLLLEIVSRTAATTGISVSSTRLTEGSLTFAAEFDSEDWSGNVKAVDIFSGTTEWEAAAGLDATPSGSREIVTSQADGTGEEPFSVAMSPFLKAKIDANVATASDIIRFVRGDDVAGFRERNTILGDIVNSRPVFMGPTNEGWSRLPGTAGTSYAAFVDSKEAKGNAVFVGANDGMLHAFDDEDGDELFGFVPRAVLPKLKELTRDPYDHQFFVDGQVVVRDVFGGGWKRVLVGTLGAGGRGVYAIDVTDPDSPDVLWEITSQEDPDIGFTFGDPVITRLGNGTWVAMFGNGYNSQDNDAILYVVDLFNGTVREKIVLENRSDDNGLSGIAPLLDPLTRLNTSRVYAGDLQGNVWRVDFSDTGNGSVAFGGAPLFTDPDNRPITSTPGLAASPAGGLFVFVGTGKLIEPEDRLVGGTAMERFYALRDQEDSLPNNPQFGEPTITNGPDGRVLTGESGEDGWVLNLSDSGSPSGERVLARPRIIFGQVIFSTFEPEDDPCAPGGEQRLYVLDALTGGGALDDICNNCGVIRVGIGAPIDPPVLIIPPQRPGEGPGADDPTNPFTGDPNDPNDPGSVGSVSGWCSQFATLNPATRQPLVIGTICDGRQVWRQAR